MVDDRGQLRGAALLFDVLEQREENHASDRLVGEQQHLVHHGRHHQIRRFAQTVAHFVHDRYDFGVVHVALLQSEQEFQAKRAAR